MSLKDSVREFYFQRKDSSLAFEYRLRECARSLGKRSPDYEGLAVALAQLPLSEAIAIADRCRSELFQLLRSPETARQSSVSFLEALVEVVRASGDMDLTAVTFSAFVRHALRIPGLDDGTYESGSRLLRVLRDDRCVSKTLRAELSLTMAEIQLQRGDHRRAARQIRKAFQLSREHGVSAHCFRLLGDLDLAEGLYGQSRRKYERSMRHRGDRKGLLDNGDPTAIRWLLTKIKTGEFASAVDGLDHSLVPSHGTYADATAITAFMLQLGRAVSDPRLLDIAQRMCSVLKHSPSRWKECCALSLAIADYLVHTGQGGNAHDHLEYVLRMSSKQGDPISVIEASLLSAKACWYAGEFDEALRAIAAVEDMQGAYRPGGTVGSIQALKSKTAFYQQQLLLALRLATQSRESLFRARAWRAYCEASTLVGAIAIWAGMPDLCIGVMHKCLEIQEASREPVGLFRSYLVLSAAYHSVNRSDESRRYFRISDAMGQVVPSSYAGSLRRLIESDFHCYKKAFGPAKTAAQSAIEQAKMLEHRMLQALCYYQFIKVLILSGERVAASSCLDMARSDYVCCRRTMWDQLETLVGMSRVAISNVTPVGAFPI